MKVGGVLIRASVEDAQVNAVADRRPAGRGLVVCVCSDDAGTQYCSCDEQSCGQLDELDEFHDSFSDGIGRLNAPDGGFAVDSLQIGPDLAARFGQRQRPDDEISSIRCHLCSICIQL